jgi:Reverse transcriptase (RNA-dependent DNA polymerase)/Endonuclease-reverse transcriptase
MNNSATSPFHLVFLNAQSLPASLLATWQALVSGADHLPSLPTTPLLYALVETGHSPPHLLRDWSSYHLPGPDPKGKNNMGGGGISLLYHKDCPILVLPTHSTRIDPTPDAAIPASSAVVCAVIRPRHRSPFLLAVVYLQPQRAKTSIYLNAILQHIEAASQSHPSLPLLVIGDFNCHHVDWKCPMALSNPSSPSIVSSCAHFLSSWIEDTGLDIANPPDMATREVLSGGVLQRSIIDLIITSPGLVSSVTQRHSDHLRTDHIPFTVELSLLSNLPPPRDQTQRGRVTWDHHTDADVWQDRLDKALTTALHPLQLALHYLTVPIPPTTTAQAMLDSAYDQFEQILTSTFLQVVGTKVVYPSSSPWLRYPGVRAARIALHSALKAVRITPHDPSLRPQLRSARATWRKVSREAKQRAYTDLCEQIMVKDCKLRWGMFKRASPSQFSSLSSIADPLTNALPVDHTASLDNLCTAFVANSTPPPPSNPLSHLSLEQQICSWADPSHSSPIPPHPSDDWTFTTTQVEEQCRRQYTNTAPGPDSILPIFLKHAGLTAWHAMATIFTFSWTHSVTPQAWREANVMALYKGAGDKSQAGSYRPISMTSIIIRTFEHLIHRLLAEELESRNYFATAQFGFRRNRSTTDAIHSLLSSIQRVLKLSSQSDALQCPVLFLDIQKAFDRVDHSILLQRVHDAGITGKAWLWIRSFLSHRRMRCVDASEYSAWRPIHHGVPQGCVLSPLLFLIFINGLQKTISGDPNCSLISPTFFADDGAIGPHPTRLLPIASSFQAKYLAQLKTAISHLNKWCKDSRMCFGAAKTQLVIFTTRQTPLTSPYESLTLCGFTISLASEYKYLGVYLTQRLTWTRHIRHAIQHARRASSLVTRVVLKARPHLDFSAVRSLVQGYVIPSYSYGILFWGRFSDLPMSSSRILQAAAATPLRTALSLPTTTHQLGVLEMCHIPTVASLALSAQLAHLHRVRGNVLPASHPTMKVHSNSITEALGRTAACTHAGPVLSPSATLTTPVFVGVSSYPPLCSDPLIAPHLSQATRAALKLPPPVGSSRGAEYWHSKSADRLRWSQQHFPYRSDPSKPSCAGLSRILRWSMTSAQGLSAPIIHELRWLSAHAEWRRQHLAPDHPVGTPDPPHSTSSPLTVCKPSPGLAPFLHRLSPDKHHQQVTRARLLLGRARTGVVLHRFAKTAEMVTINANCLYCSTPSNPIAESIPHVLLHCPRYAGLRSQLEDDIRQPPPLPLPPLSLSTILVASPPPPPFPTSLLPRLIRLTSTFLGAVASIRAADGLPHLDTG